MKSFTLSTAAAVALLTFAATTTAGPIPSSDIEELNARDYEVEDLFARDLDFDLEERDFFDDEMEFERRADPKPATNAASQPNTNSPAKPFGMQPFSTPNFKVDPGMEASFTETWKNGVFSETFTERPVQAQQQAKVSPGVKPSGQQANTQTGKTNDKKPAQPVKPPGKKREFDDLEDLYARDLDFDLEERDFFDDEMDIERRADPKPVKVANNAASQSSTNPPANQLGFQPFSPSNFKTNPGMEASFSESWNNGVLTETFTEKPYEAPKQSKVTTRPNQANKSGQQPAVQNGKTTPTEKKNAVQPAVQPAGKKREFLFVDFDDLD